MEQAESKPEPITPQRVEDEQKRAESSYIKLMDDMEASVPENGQFFTKLGGVSKDNNGITTDTRALVLNEGRPKESKLDRELNTLIDSDKTDPDLEIPGFPKARFRKIHTT